jgi:peptidoglycan/LPS O-acetylase OafA/YrhL
MSALTQVRLAIGLAGGAACVTAYQVQVDNLPWTTPTRASLIVGIGAAFLVAGLVVLGLTPEPDDHRRVLAVLAFLRA